MQGECNGLLKECSALRSEKQDMVNKHQKEKSGLQSECASLRAEKEDLLKTQHREKASLQDECTKLRSEKEAAQLKQQQLEKDLARSVVGVLLRARPALPPACSLWLTVHQQFPVRLIHYFHTLLGDLCFFVFDSLRSQNAELSGSVKALESSQEELGKRLAAVQLQHQQENAKLQTQLDEADSHSKALEREVILSVTHLIHMSAICWGWRTFARLGDTDTRQTLVHSSSEYSARAHYTSLWTADCI